MAKVSYFRKRTEKKESSKTDVSKKNWLRYSRDREIVAGDILKYRMYSDIRSVEAELKSKIASKREEWLSKAFLAYDIAYNKDTMTARDIKELFDSKEIKIIKDEVTGIDKVYIGTRLIAEWDNDNFIRFDFDGRMSVKISYYIKPLTN